MAHGDDLNADERRHHFGDIDYLDRLRDLIHEHQQAFCGIGRDLDLTIPYLAFLVDADRANRRLEDTALEYAIHLMTERLEREEGRARKVLAELTARGYTAAIHSQTIHLSGPEPPPPELERAIKDYRAGIIAQLQAPEGEA